MRRDALIAWSQFEIMMRTGMPHAMDIAAELVRYDLVCPLPTLVPKPEIDLQFYCVIHRAYRAHVLPQFLSTMELLKQTDLWNSCQCSQEKQLTIVQLCQEFSRLPPRELNRRIVSHLFETFTESKVAA